MDDINKCVMDFLYTAEFTENKKINTVRSLRKDMEQFCNYLTNTEKNTDINKVDIVTIRGFLQFLQKNNVGRRSINRKLSTLRSFFRYALRLAIITKNPMDGMISPDFDTVAPDILSLDEIDKLRAVIDVSNTNGLRDRTIVELLYSSGITATEMLGIGESVLNKEKRELMVYNGKSSRIVFFSRNTLDFYEKYIESKKIKYKDKYDPNIVFVNGSGSRLSDRSLRRIIDRYADRVGIEREISPYSFRHTFAVYMLSHGMDINCVKKLMGHVTIESTMVYENIVNKSVNNKEGNNG